MSTIILTTGVPGSGKTYIRCARFLVDDFLMTRKGGVHYSNFPVNVDIVADYVHARLKSRSGFFYRLLHRNFILPSVDDIKSRIVVIPDDVLSSWRSEGSGPWDYFKDLDLSGCHIALDEIHEIVKVSSTADYIAKWDEFLGTIRHRGCNFEGLTQDIKSVHTCFKSRANIRYELIPCEDLRDPFFSIRLYDWYQLKAGFFGEFHKTVFLVEKMKQSTGFFKEIHRRRFFITPDYFRFYDSYNKTLSQGDGFENSDFEFRYEYQEKSKLGLVLWFIQRNYIYLLTRLAIFVLFFWLCFGGGIVFLIHKFLNYTNHIVDSNSSVVLVSSEDDNGENSDYEINLDYLKGAGNVAGLSVDYGIEDGADSGGTLVEGGAVSGEGGAVSGEGGAVSGEKEKVGYREKNDFEFLKFISLNYAILGNGDYIHQGMSFIPGHFHEGYYVYEINYKLGYVQLRSSSGVGTRVLRLRLSDG